MAKARTGMDIRMKAVLLLVLAILLIGVLLRQTPDSWVVGSTKDYSDNAQTPTFLIEKPVEQTIEQEPAQPMVSAKLDPNAHVQQRKEQQLKQQFSDAAELLRIGHHQQAITILHKVLQERPTMPEAHVNLGFAMLGLGDLVKAVKSFNHAIELRPDQANAYYGLALVAEAEQEYELAIGAMRSYLHLRKNDDYAFHARAALEEWRLAIDQQKKTEQQSNADQLDATTKGASEQKTEQDRPITPEKTTGNSG